MDRGYELYFAGYIHDVRVCRQSNTVFMMSKCWATQRKSVKYVQKVAFQEEDEPSGKECQPAGMVTFATCVGCVAGTDGGLCAHVLALLYAVDSFRSTRDTGKSPPGPESVTSMPQQWGPRKRNVEPQPVMDLVVEKSKTQAERKGPRRKCTLYEARTPKGRGFSEADLEEIRDVLPLNSSLKQILPTSLPHSVATQFGAAPLGSFLSYHVPAAKASTSLHANTTISTSTDPSSKFPPLPLPSKVQPMLDGLALPISLRDAQHIERQTIGQAGNAEWLRLHKSTLTASNFWRIGHSGRGADSLLRSIFDGPALDHVPAIAHGRAHEKEAVERYVADKRTSGTPVRVRGCGLVLSTQHRYIGASPDGVVFDKSAKPHFGLLEVKCPYSPFTKSLSVEDAAAQENFCLEVVGGSLRLRKNHPYFWQVQGQLAVSNMKWCDFVVWIGQSLFIERVRYDSDLWTSSILPSLCAFYSSHALPYLSRLGRHVPSIPKAPAPPATPLPHPMSQFEQLLPFTLCQSRIDGRSGSNACTIIAAVFLRKFLLAISTATDLSSCVSAESLCLSMREGNAAYDALNTVALLSADEVLKMQPSVGVKETRELFVRSDSVSLDHLVEDLSLQAQAAPFAGACSIFITTPFSFSFCCYKDRFILFDSHSHGVAGALIADVPLNKARAYIEYFFATHYAHAQFCSVPNTIAQITFLALQQPLTE